MGAIHNDGGGEAEHLGDIAEINYEVVVAEAVAALSEPHIGGAALTGFLYRVAHVATT